MKDVFHADWGQPGCKHSKQECWCNVILVGQSTWSSCRDNTCAASSLLSQSWTLTAPSIACPESGRAPFHSFSRARGLNPASPSPACAIFCKSHMGEQSVWGLTAWSGQIPEPCCKDLSRAWYQPGYYWQFHRHSLTTFNDLSELLQPFGFL